jgi:hypothetical protein
MKAERSITAARHSTGQTIKELSKFAVAVLSARHYPHADQVGAQLRSLTPLFNLLLAKRTVGSPALVVRTDDMQISLYVDYDMSAEDNLSVPPMDLLDELSANAEIEVSVLVTEEVAPALADLVRATDGKPALVSLTSVAPGQPEALKPDPDLDVPAVPEPEPAEDREEEPSSEGTIPKQKTPDEEVTRPVQ